jgi:hypothetical protein
LETEGSEGLKTNTYGRQFVSCCPNNGVWILYTLSIVTDGRVIPVEDIVSAAEQIGSAYHEVIADKLHARFGGRQTLSAHHHGVDITTVRDEA